VVAALLSGAVAGGVTKIMGDTPTGKIVATIVPALVMFALALGLALAFGLGGRSVAQQLLESAYTKGQEQREQVKRDIETGRQNAQTEASQYTQERPSYVQPDPYGTAGYRPEGGASAY
jgi:hypothetical protein